MSFCLFAGMVLNGQALKVAASSNVGINIANPATQLHVVGNTGDIAGTFETTAGSTATRVKVDHPSNTGLSFQLGGSPTFAAVSWNPNGNNGDFSFFNDQTPGGLGSLFIDGNTNNATFAGTVSGMGSFNGSDRKLKRNVKKYEDGLSKIMKINPIMFQYNKSLNTGADDRVFIGVIAQELQKIEPSVVSTFKHYETDDKMKSTGVVKEYLQVQSDAVQYMLVNAVKEQQGMIEELQSQNEDLRNMVEALVQQASVDKIKLNLEGLNGQATLGQNAPNPFSSTTSFSYFIPEESKNAKILITNSSGQMIKSVNINNTGQGILELDASEISTGNFQYTLIVDGKTIATKKMAKVK